MSTKNQFSAFSLLTADSLPEGVVETSTEIIEETPEDQDGKNEPPAPNPPADDKSSLKIKHEAPPGTEEEEELDETEDEEGKEGKGKSTEDEPEEDEPIVTFAKILDEKGIIELDPETFEPSEEGLVKAVESTISKGIEEYKAGLGEKSLQLIEYLENGGTIDRFMEINAQADFTTISEEELKEDLSLQKTVVRNLLKIENYSDEEIEQELADYEEAGIMFNKAKRATARIKVIREEQVRAEVEAQKEYAKQRNLQYDKWLKDLEADISKRNEIAGFQVPEKQKKEFFKYITEPVRVKTTDPQTGKEVWVAKTRMMIDSEKDPDAQLKMAWLYFNNFDFSKVEKKAKQQVTSKLQEQLRRTQGEGKNLSTTKRTRAPEDVAGDFSLFKKHIK